MRLTISGPIGSGKSSVGKKLASLLGYDFFSGGTFFRQLADKYGMSLEEFNVYAENHIEIDKQQDQLILDFMKQNDNVVVESRLVGWICYGNSIDSFRIFIDAPFETRVKRVSGREKSDQSRIRELVKEREESEIKRYREFYGIDFRDGKYYDLIINTDKLSVQQVVNEIYDKVKLHRSVP